MVYRLLAHVTELFEPYILQTRVSQTVVVGGPPYGPQAISGGKKTKNILSYQKFKIQNLLRLSENHAKNM
jgi:hypothetical protein